MFSSRATKFAATAVAATAIGLGGLAAAATASAETYQGGVVGGPAGGHATLHWQGVHPGHANVTWH